MDLDKNQKKLFAPTADSAKEMIAMSESMGMSHAFAKLSEKVEIINLLLVPALTTTGLIAGEVKNMYLGKGDNSKELEKYLSDVIQSISVIASVLEIPLSRIVENAFREKNENNR